MTTRNETITTDSALNNFKIIIRLNNEKEIIEYQELNLSSVSDAFVIDLSEEGEKTISLNSFKEALKEQDNAARQIVNNYKVIMNEERLNRMLSGTNCKVSIFQTEDYYGEGDEDISEDHNYYGLPMFEAYIMDGDENPIEDTTTGRFCCIDSVSDELEGYVLVVKAAREIEFDDSPYTYNEDIKSVIFDPECQSGMLENYGEDFIQIQEIENKTPKRIWSVIDGEDDKVHVVAGMRLTEVVHYVVSNEDFREYGETYFYGCSDSEEVIKSYSIFAVSENGTENVWGAASEDKAKEEVKKFTKMLNNGTFVNRTSLEDIKSFNYDEL